MSDFEPDVEQFVTDRLRAFDAEIAAASLVCVGKLLAISGEHAMRVQLLSDGTEYELWANDSSVYLDHVGSLLIQDFDRGVLLPVKVL